jgi:hypothetical protein
VVQDPATAQFAGMLRSAVTAGDYVIAAEKMPEFLLRYGRHGYMADPDGRAAKASGEGDPPVLKRAPRVRKPVNFDELADRMTESSFGGPPNANEADEPESPRFLPRTIIPR